MVCTLQCFVQQPFLVLWYFIWTNSNVSEFVSLYNCYSQIQWYSSTTAVLCNRHNLTTIWCVHIESCWGNYREIRSRRRYVSFDKISCLLFSCSKWVTVSKDSCCKISECEDVTERILIKQRLSGIERSEENWRHDLWAWDLTFQILLQNEIQLCKTGHIKTMA